MEPPVVSSRARIPTVDLPLTTLLEISARMELDCVNHWPARSPWMRWIASVDQSVRLVLHLCCRGTGV